MGRITFGEEHRKKDASSFPKLRLEQNESARILVIEKEPYTEYVHTLRAPKIVNGEPVEETVEKDGVTTTSIVQDFIGNPLCLGDAGTLEDDGIDPKNCPVCAVAATGDMVDPPKRRFAINILKYATKPGTSELREPFNVDVLVWSFTDQIYNKLLDAQKEWDNLQEHDLLLGPCTNKNFQKFDIQVAKVAQWQASDERRALAVSTFKANKADDDVLKMMCGRTAKKSFLEEDLAKIKARWKVANNARRSQPAITESPALDEALDGLLLAQGADPAPSTHASLATASDPFADVLAPTAASPEVTPEVVEAVKEEKTAATLGKPGSSGEKMTLDDLDALMDL